MSGKNPGAGDGTMIEEVENVLGKQWPSGPVPVLPISGDAAASNFDNATEVRRMRAAVDDDVEVEALDDDVEELDEEVSQEAAAVAAAAAATVPDVPDSATLTEDPSEWSRKRRRLNAGNYRERLNAEEAELRRFEEARTAKRKEAVAQRKAAAAAAAAETAAAGVSPGSGLQALKTMNAKIRLDIYNAASENLYPILMLTNAELSANSPDDFREISLTDIFTKKLSFVCDMLFGKNLRENLATMFSQPSAKRTNIRDFFEFDDPNAQCSGVIGGIKPETNCWLCRVTLAGTRLIPCEHKLPLLPALLLTGLYDRNLAAYLIREGKARYADYMELLRFEYGWSHQRCNQIKSDIPFFIPKVNDGKRVTFEFDPVAIQGLVIAIRQSTRHESFSPKQAWLHEKGIGTEKALIAAIEAEMTPLLTKLNAKNFTTNQLMSHFVRGLLDRVVNLAPAQAERFLSKRLNPAQQARVAARLKGLVGGRRRTRAQRRGTYRRQRGGVIDEDDLISQYVFDRVKEKDIQALYDNAFQTAIIDITAAESPDALFKLFEFYADTTDNRAFDIIEEIPMFQGSNDEEVFNAFEEWLGVNINPPSPGDKRPASSEGEPAAKRATLTVNTAAAPAPAPDSTPASGDSSPFSVVAASPPRGVSGQASNQAAPVGMLSPQTGGPVSRTEPPPTVRGPGRAPAPAPAAASGVGPDSEATLLGSFGPGEGEDNSQRRGGFKFTMGKRPNWL